jgi:hypothetical protein
MNRLKAARKQQDMPMWFKDAAEDKARKDFAKALHAYAEALPPDAVNCTINARQSWNYIADEIDKGTEDGVSFYGVFKNTLKLPPKAP